jgi:multicomponent Na+:H+ antiporter subunit F
VILATVAGAVLLTMFMNLIRAIRGPTVFDRILAVNAFATQTVLLIAVIGFLSGRPDWLDLALVYALLGFIGVLAVLRFAKFGELADDIRERS